MGTQATGTLQKIYSENLQAELTITQCGWTREAEEKFGIAAIIAGEIPIDRYWIATEDGRGMIREWERKPTGEGIYYERWEADGRGGHGWIDKQTRKIIQTG